MRTVLHVHHGTAPGGAPESLLRLLSRLDRGRFGSIVALPKEGALAERFRAAGLTVVTGPIAPLYALVQAESTLRNRLRHALVAPFERAFIRRLIRAHRPDLVHVNTGLLPNSALAAAEAGVPVLLHVREVVAGDRRAARHLIDPARRAAGHIVAISEVAATPFRVPGGPPVTVIPEGVDTAAFHRPDARERIRAELGASSSNLVLLVPAMLLPAKGHGPVVAALSELRRRIPHLVVWMAGGAADRDYARRIEREAAAVAPPETVRWLGHRSDMPELLAGSDLVAFLPRAAEGFGLPLIEAMAAGRPVLGPDHGPSRDILSDGVEGRLIDPGDPRALIDAVTTLAATPEVRAAMGEAGRRRARADFDLATMVGRFERLFEQTCDDRSPE